MIKLTAGIIGTDKIKITYAKNKFTMALKMLGMLLFYDWCDVEEI